MCCKPTFLGPKSRVIVVNAAKLLMSMTFAAKTHFSGSTTPLRGCTNQEGTMTNKSSAVIVNLTEQTWTLHRSYGAYRVRGCGSGEPFALTRVESRTAYMDLGD